MVFQNNLLAGASGASGTGFDTTLISNSVWLDGSSDGLTKPANEFDDEDGKEFTLGTWFQLTEFGVTGALFCAGNGSGTYTSLRHGADNKIFFQTQVGNAILSTTPIYRDTAWYHILVSVDTTQSTAGNRVRLFINGVEETFSGTQPSLNHVYEFNLSSIHEVGDSYENGAFQGYLAQSFMIGSKSIQQGDFAITDFLDSFTFGTNGSQFGPKKNSEIKTLVDTGSDNSFLLQYENSSALGTDSSTNTNTFTATSMGATNQTIHTPSNVYPKISILGKPSGDTAASYSMSSGSNRMTYSGSNQVAKGLVSDKVIQSDDPKIYWEFYVEAGSVGGSSGGRLGNGIVIPQFNAGNGNGFYGAGGESAYLQRGTLYDNGSASVSSFTTPAVGGVQNFAFEPSTGKVWIGVDGTWRNGSATASTTLNIDNHDDQLTVQDYIFVIGLQRSGDIGVINFGDNPTFSGNETAGTNADENGHGLFKYAVPATFLAPCSANLTGPENQGVDYFQPVTYTGNGSVRSISTDIDPAWVWLKNRSQDDEHKLVDVVRGATKELSSDSTAAESTDTNGLTAFGTGSFSLGSGANGYNDNTENFVAWCWQASTAYTNDASATGIGTIDSSGRISASDSFSIVSYTGDGNAGASIKHGMSGAPEFFFTKESSHAERGWITYHEYSASDPQTDFGRLESAAVWDDDTTLWNDTAPTSSVITLGLSTEVNASGEPFIMYAFRSVPGVCKVGSYIGNGDSTVPPYVHLGFRPRFVIFKNATVARDWVITDTARSPSNPAELFLFPNDEDAEAARGPASGSDYDIDLLAEGFRPLSGDSAPNGNGNIILYMAMADIGGNGILPPIYGR